MQHPDDKLPEFEADTPDAIHEEQPSQLDMVGEAIAKRRNDAIDYRKQSGIEAIWLEDEEHYEGIDDANRGEEHYAVSQRYQKPASMDGTLTERKAQSNRATAFPNITKPYVDGAAARMGDILLPSDDRPWDLDTTPVPELTSFANGETEDSQVQFAGKAVSLKDLSKEALEIAKKARDAARTQIEDWLTEADWRGEVRRVIHDCAKLGTGILKGPYPVMRRHVAFKRDPQSDMVTQEIMEEVKPGTRRVDPWNFYPAAGCGEDIHSCDWVFERDELSKKDLRNLRQQPGYLAEQITKCLMEGPQLTEMTEPTRASEKITDDTNYEIWTATGFLEFSELEACGCSMDQREVHPETGERMGPEPDPAEVFPCVVSLVNGRVIRAIPNPLDNGDFPYDVITWTRRARHWAGIGIARQVRTPQRQLVANYRAMMNNLALCSGPQIVLLQGVVHPADDNYDLYANKIWVADPEAALADLKAAFLSVNIDCRQQELMAAMDLALRLAEEVTGMPAIVQGQERKETTERVGIAQIQNANANTLQRRIAREFDDKLFEPNIERHYQWLMQYGEDENAKGLFVIKARGSSVLIERDIQNQNMMQMAPMVINPVFEADPVKYFDELVRAMKLDPDRFHYDPEKLKALKEAAANQPQDPRIMVEQMRAQVEQQRMQFEQGMAQMQQKFEAAQAEAERKTKILIEGMQHEARTVEIQGNVSVEGMKVKAGLAEATAMKQADMAMQEREIAVKEKEGSGI